MVCFSVGIGKTSLIKSIVQACEDIVHVDPISSNNSISGSRTGSSYYAINNREEGGSTRQITEVYASTRPYPHWWSELDETKLLRKRKSKPGIDDQIIERNLCFIDTPGYGFGTSVGSPLAYLSSLVLFSLTGVITRLTNFCSSSSVLNLLSGMSKAS